jgi:hypothetical protein
MVVQPSTAEVERVFCRMNDAKTPERCRMALGTLDTLLRVSISGPPLNDFGG